mmetsp:Transcript_1946/g.3505  ORF Transcript_1946/g.3505 Transcript_1946/m.3505 type:complete len:216 (-) Transcript_1946:129-776(-)|eukprot:CAMPEP_0202480384 /NCGR_PEP_ID=MMETSP1361-20130828/395_1 /ASSEMBLY_ACC=CAM_ASM_000849 /TAXON_ID=210615 /ORGANISM="Staurosira complex sp., Strain CCMP2646" /LENGTH=215 /DNA_ID=CAMNT_0049107811 /DNA_START=184 /DNA_END=831 /DNA_ORIENTATION=-
MKISPLAAILLGTTLLFGDASPLTRARHLQDAEDGASTDIAAANTNKNNSGGGTICNCANPFYYFIIDTKNKISYQDAILRTPAKCILAPIPSVLVLQEIQTYVPQGLFWVGITRSAKDATTATVDISTQRANWYNLDGTAGPGATSGTTFTNGGGSIWAGSEPNQGDTVAYFSNKTPYGLVGTTRVDTTVDGAIYKCCIDFCSDQSVSDQLGLS